MVYLPIQNLKFFVNNDGEAKGIARTVIYDYFSLRHAGNTGACGYPEISKKAVPV